MASLEELLLQYDANVLKTFAVEHRVSAKNVPKTALAKALARKLADPAELERTLAGLGPAEREILALVQRAGGQASTSVLRSIVKKSPTIAPSPNRNERQTYQATQGDPNYRGQPRLEDVAARLALMGLAFARELIGPSYNKQVIAWELGRYLVIPSEIAARLPSWADEASARRLEPARRVAGSARIFQRDLSRYRSFVERGKLELTTQGWVYKKTLTELVKHLGWDSQSLPDEKNNPYLFFLRRMLAALDTARTVQPTPRQNPSAANSPLPGEKSFWVQPPAERIQRALEAYLGTTEWNELRVPKGTYGLDHRRPAPVELQAARRVVVERLKQRGAASWVALADLLDDLRLGHYEFLFPRYPSARPVYYGYPEATPYSSSSNPYGVTYQDIRDEASGWDMVEGAIITHIVTGPLHWLGLTDVGFDAGAPIAYRLTPTGAWLLGLGAEIEIAEQGGRVVAQPNFQIVAMEPIADTVLMTLDEFADFEGGDRASTYRLTRESVYRGQRARWDAARIIAFLEDATHAPLPQNVKRSLEEWQALHERVTIRRGVTLLQTEDSAALDELYAEATLALRLGRRVGAEIALPSERAQTVHTALRDAGWLAVLTARDRTEAPASVVSDDDGQVEFVQRTPSLYAYQGLEPFAERIDPRHARITPASVASATQHGLAVPEMIERLRRVHRGEIPPKLIARLKAWGKYFGAAKLGTLTLIEFRDETARAELLDDPELKHFLTRFDAGQRPLALVRAADLARVKELLADRGVDIVDWNAE